MTASNGSNGSNGAAGEGQGGGHAEGHGGGGHGGAGDRSAEGVRAMVDIGQLGLEMASAVVERVLDTGFDAWRGFSSNGGPDGAFSARRAGPAPDRHKELRRLRADADRLMEVYAEWMRSWVDGLLDLVTERPGSRSQPDALAMGPVAPGGASSAGVWLHLLDGPGAGVAALRSSELTRHDGRTVSSACVTFEPPALDTSAARTSHEVRVTVTLPPDVAAGVYHGHVLVSGLDEVWLPMRVEVKEHGAP